ncbi:MAG: 3-hydroxybutyryl-CoA dehydrogenase [Anaerolineae bacterium]|nr:3-hydroxybutyryl-CoA dehydrogenase [Anaerolineae bacterium]
MSNVLVIGDGPLAYEITETSKLNGHGVTPYFTNERGPDFSHPYINVEQIVSRSTDLILEAAKNKINYWYTHGSEYPKILTDIPILTLLYTESATHISNWLRNAPNVIGWAALPPFEKAKAVEIMPGLQTNQATLEAAQQFFTSLGKEPVIIKDCVGGVLPRVVASLINNAAYALMEGVASAADIDVAMKLGTNYPYGPLEWADKIGLDQVLGILEGLCEAYGEDRYRPAPNLRQLVYAGHWGERTGRGFYEYP